MLPMRLARRREVQREKDLSAHAAVLPLYVAVHSQRQKRPFIWTDMLDETRKVFLSGLVQRPSHWCWLIRRCCASARTVVAADDELSPCHSQGRRDVLQRNKGVSATCPSCSASGLVIGGHTRSGANHLDYVMPDASGGGEKSPTTPPCP